ncbi:TraR/DksA C4-type zinc finger protein [Candidatus Uhrbacteria bacterium]|nr:TraR/DksA C4-type zinc finger protein [Candidatus Uhrbacteria bacterium]
MINAAFKKKMLTLLQEEKAHLEKELASFSHRNPNAHETKFETDFPNMGDKLDENASEVAQFSDNLSLEDELEKALRDVVSALGMIEKGTYGTCKYCKQSIDERRLEARPTSTSCISCKKTLTQEV